MQQGAERPVAPSRSQSLLDIDREIERKIPRVQQESESYPDPSEPLPIQQQTYFDSPQAKKLFIGNSKSNDNVVSILEDRIEMLQHVSEYPEGWRDVVDHHDKDNLCSAFDIFVTRQRSQILCLAYIYALDNMNEWTWLECSVRRGEFQMKRREVCR